ncbi:MAG: hypothetical protein ABIH48_02745 [Candidatus Falkowbacteria bacterium]
MTLYINTTDSEIMTVALGDKGVLMAKSRVKAKYQQSEKLLKTIDKLLGSLCLNLNSRRSKPCVTGVGRGKVQRALDLSQIKGIVVVNGSGPFSATRIGVATANALAYGLNISVVGIKANEFENIDELIKKGYQRVKNCKKNNTVEPFYDKEPSITKSKKSY